VKLCGAVSPAHFRSQVDPPSQETEQGPLQVTWQVAWSPQETDPDTPTLIVHSEASQVTLPDSPVES
jgi:hypothetical protein